MTAARRESKLGEAAYRCWLFLCERAGGLGVRRKPPPDLLTVVAKLDLGSRKSLLVVASGGRRFLVAQGAETVAAMLEIRPPGGATPSGAVPSGAVRSVAALRAAKRLAARSRSGRPLTGFSRGRRDA